MVATTSWRCVVRWNASSFCSSAALRSAGSTLAASTTSPVKAGKGCANAGGAISASSIAPAAANSEDTRRGARAMLTTASEVDLGGGLGVGAGRLERRDRLGAVDQLGGDRVGE